jgi:hypothetical protein
MKNFDKDKVISVRGEIGGDGAA